MCVLSVHWSVGHKREDREGWTPDIIVPLSLSLLSSQCLNIGRATQIKSDELFNFGDWRLKKAWTKKNIIRTNREN